MNSSILKSVDAEKHNGEVIAKRVISPYYISDYSTIEDVAEIFISNSSIQVIGVVDSSGLATGIVVRNELFSLIGQKFGRELYLKRNIAEVTSAAETIYYKRNTFSVIDELAGDLKSTHNTYYLLVDSWNMYRGVISSLDLVLFLSEMMTRELKSARRIHSAIITDGINIGEERFEVCGSTMMALETGGDFQYIREIADNRWFVSLCDVSGKGLNAGLISVAVSSMYTVYDFSRGIRELVCRINSYINSLFGGEIFLTGVFMMFDRLTGEVELYDMGHSMVYLINDRSITSPVSNCNNLPLGVQKDIDPVKNEIRLTRGDILISYTDGFPEQNNIRNESFGEERMLSLAAKYRNSSLWNIKDIINEEVLNWRSGSAQGDDMSILMLRYRGE